MEHIVHGLPGQCILGSKQRDQGASQHHMNHAQPIGQFAEILLLLLDQPLHRPNRVVQEQQHTNHAAYDRRFRQGSHGGVDPECVDVVHDQYTTSGWGLEQQQHVGEEVLIGIVESELHYNSPGVNRQPVHVF